MARKYKLFPGIFLLLQLITGILAQLPMRMNDNLASNKKFVYTLNAEFRDDIEATWSNENIAFLAQQAYEAMISKIPTDKATYRLFKKPSPLVSAIVKGHSVYFSSTLTGGGSIQYIPNQNCPYKDTWTPGNQIPSDDCALVSQALQACQLRSSNNSGHRTGGNCGEVMAAMAFCTVSPSGTLVGAKVVTWGNFQNVQSVWDPCEKHNNDLASAPTWGCLSFTKQLDMTVIGKGTNPSAKEIPAFTATYSELT